MPWAVVVNVVFELLATVTTWRSVVLLAQAGDVVGIDPLQQLVSALWAGCAPFYYLNRRDSWAAGVATARCLGLLTWCALAWGAR